MKNLFKTLLASVFVLAALGTSSVKSAMAVDKAIDRPGIYVTDTTTAPTFYAYTTPYVHLYYNSAKPYDVKVHSYLRIWDGSGSQNEIFSFVDSDIIITNAKLASEGTINMHLQLNHPAYATDTWPDNSVPVCSYTPPITYGGPAGSYYAQWDVEVSYIPPPATPGKKPGLIDPETLISFNGVHF